MVSVLEGQLTRTWTISLPGTSKKHTINLFHDTITGIRSAMLDYEEIPDSLGNSSIFMSSGGHKIDFIIEGIPAYIEIRKAGWTGFLYTLIVDNQIMKEVTQVVPTNQGEELYKVTITEVVQTKEYNNEDIVSWYLVNSIRLKDNISTSVHRRFRDFAELNSQIKQNFKGNHLRSSLPLFPEKTSKLLADHNDPQFIKNRQLKLQTYMSNLSYIPHVDDMICFKTFLGIMGQVKEISFCFTIPKLGLGLVPSENMGALRTAVVTHMKYPDICPGIHVGDVVSRVGGVSVTNMSFQEIIDRINTSPRPLIIHFIQFLNQPANSTTTTTTTATAATTGTSNTTAAVVHTEDLCKNNTPTSSSSSSSSLPALSSVSSSALQSESLIVTTNTLNPSPDVLNNSIIKNDHNSPDDTLKAFTSIDLNDTSYEPHTCTSLPSDNVNTNHTDTSSPLNTTTYTSSIHTDNNNNHSLSNHYHTQDTAAAAAAAGAGAGAGAGGMIEDLMIPTTFKYAPNRNDVLIKNLDKLFTPTSPSRTTTAANIIASNISIDKSDLNNVTHDDKRNKKQLHSTDTLIGEDKNDNTMQMDLNTWMEVNHTISNKKENDTKDIHESTLTNSVHESTITKSVDEAIMSVLPPPPPIPNNISPYHTHPTPSYNELTTLISDNTQDVHVDTHDNTHIHAIGEDIPVRAVDTMIGLNTTGTVTTTKDTTHMNETTNSSSTDRSEDLTDLSMTTDT